MFREKHIVIDFTGGQKVTSVLAATVTINRDILSQYVSNAKDHPVLGYDLVFGADTAREHERLTAGASPAARPAIA